MTRVHTSLPQTPGPLSAPCAVHRGHRASAIRRQFLFYLHSERNTALTRLWAARLACSSASSPKIVGLINSPRWYDLSSSTGLTGRTGIRLQARRQHLESQPNGIHEITGSCLLRKGRQKPMPQASHPSISRPFQSRMVPRTRGSW